jgi:hypothetical protein
VNVTAVSGVRDEEAGLASGLLNTAQWAGGALGIAAASAAVSTKSGSLLAGGASLADALTGGLQAGFSGCARRSAPSA